MSYRDATFEELCTVLFASFRRADQRARGAEYLRGLLATRGRKSIRNIAAAVGGTEQSLHHFVSDSTWDWVPVRRALTEFVVGRAQPRAWVLRPMVIPKAGNQSVGVGKRFDPALGQTLNAQQAVGVWAASERSATPVGWRLHLSHAWLADDDKRGRAAIPAEAAPETIGDCAVAAYLDAGLADRPVVLDTRELGAVIPRLAGVPFLARVNPTLPVGPVLPGHEMVPANWLLGAAKDLRRPVTWTEHGMPSTALAAAVRVTVRATQPEAGDLLLLGITDVGASWPGELWLTNLSAPPAVLVRLSRLTRRVDHDFTEIADQVGIRDFSGRSFVGWHRHVTLASAAHAVTALAGAASTRLAS